MIKEYKQDIHGPTDDISYFDQFILYLFFLEIIKLICNFLLTLKVPNWSVTLIK
jgi:hypothetical protein